MTSELESEKPSPDTRSNQPDAETPSVTPELADIPERNKKRPEIRVATFEWSGPIPDPQTMALYSKIDPELVKFTMERARIEQAHRHAQDAKIIQSGIDSATRGHYVGFGTTALIVVAAVMLGIWGNPALGGVLTTLAIIHQSGLTLYRQHRRDKADQKALETRTESSDPE